MNFLRKLISKSNNNKIKVDTAIIKKSIAEHLAPELRKAGWKGSGFQFYRKQPNEIIELISFYGDRYGGKMYIEIGVHLNFIPLSVPCELKQMSTAGVDIRQRINPNSEELEWKYPDTEEGIIELNKKLLHSYETEGKQFFSLFHSWEEAFQKISPKNIETYEGPIPFPLKGRTARILAFVHSHLGNHQSARAFAEYGLSYINGPNGSALRPDFEAILNKARSHEK